MFSKRRGPGGPGGAPQDHHAPQGHQAPRDHASAAGPVLPARTEFEGRFFLLDRGQGGRRTPVFSHYRPVFRFDDAYVAGTVTLPEGTEMMMPGGDWTTVTVQLAQPAPMEAGMHFSVHEDDRRVGTGQVTRVIR
jgi:elongation factor Tu